jgi:hypothetical protein
MEGINSFTFMRSTDLEELLRASLHHMTVGLDIFDTHRVGAANIDILFFVAKNVLLYLLKGVFYTVQTCMIK